MQQYSYIASVVYSTHNTMYYSAATNVLNLLVYTVNITNFFDFGVDTGDTQLVRYGNSHVINLLTPIQLYGTQQQTLHVSLLSLTCIA